ncbi:MAG: ABC transporter permease [Sulfobacillus sp.]
MSVVESLRMAWRALRGNRMRAGLTMLGIIIGVAAVIALITAGQAATSSVTSSIQALGSNLISVSPVRSSGTVLYAQDASWLLQVVPQIKADAPLIEASVTAAYQSTSWSTVVIGTTPAALTIEGRTLAAGRFISSQDVSASRNVAVLGQTVAQNLFPARNPLGQTISVNGNPFTVIGVLQATGGAFGANADNVIIVPINAAEWVAGTTELTGIEAEARSAAIAPLAVAQITAVLNHRFASTNAATVTSQDQILSTLSTITGTLTLMLGGIAGISLLVGGVGIMNIMLVTVSERTREIGLRKAMGASRRAILTQFLIESSLLSLAGGMIGVLVGVSLSLLLTHLLGAGSVPISAVLLALGFSLVVGIVFGIWPAANASRLDPVQALYQS